MVNVGPFAAQPKIREMKMITNGISLTTFNSITEYCMSS